MVGKRYTIPTLLMVVIEDLILVPEYVRSVNLDYVDKLEYLDIETGGHFVLTENPDAVNQGIKNYIEKLFGAGEIAKENEKVVAEVAKEEMKEVKEEELEEEKEVRNREQAIEGKRRQTSHILQNHKQNSFRALLTSPPPNPSLPCSVQRCSPPLPTTEYLSRPKTRQSHVSHRLSQRLPVQTSKLPSLHDNVIVLKSVGIE